MTPTTASWIKVGSTTHLPSYLLMQKLLISPWIEHNTQRPVKTHLFLAFAALFIWNTIRLNVSSRRYSSGFQEEIKAIQFDFSWGESQLEFMPFSHCPNFWQLVSCRPRGVFRGQVASTARMSQSVSRFWIVKAAGATYLPATCCMITSTAKANFFFFHSCFNTQVTLHAF